MLAPPKGIRQRQTATGRDARPTEGDGRRGTGVMFKKPRLRSGNPCERA